MSVASADAPTVPSRGAMNVHHLELFYYVARHDGISAAVRHMPYGIQQPAVSSQILQLEAHLGAKLFERKPFRLTPEGERLFAHAKPFFEQLDAVEASIGKRTATVVRIGASEIVLRDHLPAVVRRVREIHPGLRLAMREGPPAQLEALLRNRELDLLISVAPLPLRHAGLRSLGLLRLPLVLLVHRKSKIKSAAELLTRSPIEEPLICCLPSPNIFFQQGLKRQRLVWRPTIETNTLELVTWYVAHGHGVGVNLALPELVRHKDVRVLPLDGFEAVQLMAIWRGEPSAMLRTLIEESRKYGRKNWPQYYAANDTLSARSAK